MSDAWKEEKLLLEVRQMASILVPVVLWWHQLFLSTAHLQNYTIQSSAMCNQFYHTIYYKFLANLASYRTVVTSPNSKETLADLANLGLTWDDLKETSLI